MPKASIRPRVDQAFNAERDFFPEISFHHVVLIDRLTKFDNVSFLKIFDPHGTVNASFL